MKLRFVWIIFIIILGNSCRKNPEINNQAPIIPVRINSTGYTVPDDSTKIPVKVIAGTPKRILAGIPRIVYPDNNVFPVPKRKIVPAGKPEIRTPGEKTYSLPKSFPAVENPVIAGSPDVIPAGEISHTVPGPYNIGVLSKVEGLTHEKIGSMLQDNFGNIWIGTIGGGVSRYDGNSFSNYTENEGLSNNRIYSILQDNEGNLWFGSNGGGVTKYDGKFFTNFTEYEGLCNNHVFSILQDKNGKIWFGTDGGGLSVYDGQTFTHYAEKEGFVTSAINCMYEDNKGFLWFGTDGDGAICFDGRSFSNYTINEGLTNNIILCIEQDNNGILWFGTDGGGINTFDGNNFSYFTESEGLGNNSVKSMLKDKDGAIWIGTSGGGISIYDGENLTHLTEKDGLSDNSIKAMLQDKSGSIWIGSDIDGISKYEGKFFNHYTEREGLINRRINTIYQGSEGDLWFGYDYAGISKFNGKYYSHYTVKEGLSSDKINCIIEDNNNNLWFGTENGGVTKYDGKYFTNYTEKEGLCSDRVISSLQDSNGNFWFGTTQGVSKFDGESFTTFTTKEGLVNNRVFSIFQDNAGNLWFGTDGGGVTKYNGESFTHFTTKNGLSNNYIYSITQDKGGNIWFGTLGGGLTRYDGKAFIHFTKKEGLVNDFVYSLLCDKSGNIWAGTRFGLSMLSQKNLNKFSNFPYDLRAGMTDNLKKHTPVLFQNFTTDDGFVGIGCLKNSIYEDRNHTIWVGTNRNLTAYHPELDKPDTIPPNVQLTSVGLFYETINWNQIESKKDTILLTGNGIKIKNFIFSGLTKWYNIPENLSLKYNNNSIDFTFIGITLKHVKKVKYLYKLEGLDKNWSSPTLHNQVSFGNLSPGSYTFRVKAMNSEGYWSNELSYPFIIRSPWWGKLWFRLTAIIVLITTIIVVYNWRLAQLKHQKEYLEQTVIEKTSQLIQKNEELMQAIRDLDQQKEELGTALETLTATQQQLVQSEKMASLGVLAAGVAHEINNPLNFIQGGILAIENYFNEKHNGHLPEVSPLFKGIHEGVTRVARIVTSLNHYSRIDNQARENCNIHSIIDNCLVMLHNQIRGRIEIIKNYTSEVHSIVCSESKMHQAILNILSNAIQSINEKGTIIISTGIEKGSLIIKVRDTGCGIDPKLLPRIFDPFFTTKNPGEGTGLGLSITYNIVKEHKGTINFESKPGEGTSVLIKLPLKHS